MNFEEGVIMKVQDLIRVLDVEVSYDEVFLDQETDYNTLEASKFKWRKEKFQLVNTWSSFSDNSRFGLS